MSAVRIAIVEDDPILRDSLAQQVRGIEGLELVGAASSLREGKRLQTESPDLLLLDLQLPDGSGFELLALARAWRSAPKVVILSVFGDVQHVVRAIEQGADGYLLKGTDIDGVTAAIRTVIGGGAPLSPAVAGHILARVRNEAARAPRQPPRLALTQKEVLVLTQLGRGLSYKEIAALQQISTHTVADHVKSIYRKLAVNSRSEAVYEALQSGLIDLRG